MSVPMPVATRTLLMLNVGAFVVQLLTGSMLVRSFGLWPAASALYPGAPSFEVWQLVTYSFLHGDVAHIFFNLFALWMFGGSIEQLMGTRRFLTYYFTCVVGAALAQLAVASGMDSPPVPTVGASGGVFGLLLAFGMAFPHRRLMLLFPPIPMPAWLFVTLYGALELYLGVTRTGQGVAHFAHLGGMAAGFALIMYWRGQPRPPARGGG